MSKHNPDAPCVARAIAANKSNAPHIHFVDRRLRQREEPAEPEPQPDRLALRKFSWQS